MPVITVTVADRATDRLGRIAPSAREALDRILRPKTREMHEDVLGYASGHIHTVGKKPGQYLASIQSGVYDKGKRIGGYVRSGSPLAHLLEGGANPPPHEIKFSAADVLAFPGPGGGTVFAMAVHHPGAKIPPYPAFKPAMEANADAIRAELIAAVEGAARKT